MHDSVRRWCYVGTNSFHLDKISVSDSLSLYLYIYLYQHNFSYQFTFFIFIGIEAFKFIRIQAIRFSPEGRVEILHFLSQRILCWNSNLEVIYFPFPFDFIFFYFVEVTFNTFCKILQLSVGIFIIFFEVDSFLSSFRFSFVYFTSSCIYEPLLFCRILFCFVFLLFCFVLFCFVFSCFIWFWIILTFSFNRNDYISFNNNSSRGSSLQLNNMWIRNTKETINDANDKTAASNQRNGRKLRKNSIPFQEKWKQTGSSFKISSPDRKSVV